jgi:hypothetical protein
MGGVNSTTAMSSGKLFTSFKINGLALQAIEPEASTFDIQSAVKYKTLVARRENNPRSFGSLNHAIRKEQVREWAENQKMSIFDTLRQYLPAAFSPLNPLQLSIEHAGNLQPNLKQISTFGIPGKRMEIEKATVLSAKVPSFNEHTASISGGTQQQLICHSAL